MRQYHDKVKTRELYDVTGPVFWPGYNFVGPGKELATCKNCRLHSSLICGCSCSIVRLCIWQRKLTTEHFDDRQLLTMWTEWGKATSGNEWNGPTPYEKYFVILLAC